MCVEASGNSGALSLLRPLASGSSLRAPPHWADGTVSLSTQSKGRKGLPKPEQRDPGVETVFSRDLLELCS